MITPRELGWVAGFLEGEGSFLGNRSAYVGAAQVQREPLDRLQSLLGGKVRPVKSKKVNHSDFFHWTIGGGHAAGVMMCVYPLMSPRRKEQIRKALGHWMTLRVGNKYKVACPKGHPYDEVNTYRLKKRPGLRYCRTCIRESGRLANQKRKSRGVS
jgi:hypothetical protein